MNESNTLGFYCSSLSWGGLEMNTVRYAKWMQEKGFRVLLFAVAHSPIADEAKKTGVPIIVVRRNSKYFDLWNGYRMAMLFRNLGVSLVWFRDTRDMDMLAWSKRMPGSSFRLLYQQAMQFGVSKKDFFHTMRFQAIDAWVSTLNFLRDQVERCTHFPKQKIYVVPLGVDAARIKSNENLRAEARKHFQVNPSVFVFGVIGRLDPLKGQHRAVEALHLLHERNIKAHLLIVGESTRNEGSEYEVSLRKQIEQFRLEEYVHIRPYNAEVYHFFHAINAFMLCSKGETFGTVTIEAMAMGLPIMGTNSSGTPELLNQGSCGLLVDPDDTFEWSIAMEKIVGNENEMTQMGLRAKNRFNSNYSKEASLVAMIEIVEKLVERN
jgi:glycosyltransferase involved in cell wall biosynthesis